MSIWSVCVWKIYIGGMKSNDRLLLDCCEGFLQGFFARFRAKLLVTKTIRYRCSFYFKLFYLWNRLEINAFFQSGCTIIAHKINLKSEEPSWNTVSGGYFSKYFSNINCVEFEMVWTTFYQGDVWGNCYEGSAMFDVQIVLK